MRISVLREGGLAAAALADDAQRFAAHDVERDIVHGVHIALQRVHKAAVDGEIGFQVLYVEKDFVALHARTSSLPTKWQATFRSPTWRRLGLSRLQRSVHRGQRGWK